MIPIPRVAPMRRNPYSWSEQQVAVQRIAAANLSFLLLFSFCGSGGYLWKTAKRNRFSSSCSNFFNRQNSSMDPYWIMNWITLRLATNSQPHRGDGLAQSFERGAALRVLTHTQMCSFEDFSIRNAPTLGQRDR